MTHATNAARQARFRDRRQARMTSLGAEVRRLRAELERYVTGEGDRAELDHYVTVVKIIKYRRVAAAPKPPAPLEIVLRWDRRRGVWRAN
jgi:hypothetical protein